MNEIADFYYYFLYLYILNIFLYIYYYLIIIIIKLGKKFVIVRNYDDSMLIS